MRSAEVKKYWKELYSSRKYSTYLESLVLTNCMGFTGTILLNKGITVFCGLNGVGKSTIISCIKQSLGLIDNSIVTGDKAQGDIRAVLSHKGNSIEIDPKNSAIKQGFDEGKFVYIDSNQSLELLKQWVEQRNLSEYLEQFEINDMSSDQINEISWLVGKDYNECKTIETDEEHGYKSVFFQVTLKEQSYSTLDMGLGEHFLMYIYYILCNIENDAVLIIEEPETFISVLSQQRLIDYLAMISSKKRISIIITTHSPHIISMIKYDNIRIVGNVFGKMIIKTPENALEAKEHLGIAYDYNKIATIFVEDYVARIFLEDILDEDAPYLRNITDIVSVEGCEGITNRLSFDDSQYMSHKLIGVYDGDIKDKLETSKIKWPYLFLPIDECVEIELYNFLRCDTNARKICDQISIAYETLNLSLSKRVGEDHHDWFLDMCKDVKVLPNAFLKAFYGIWKQANSEAINGFISQINGIIYGDNPLVEKEKAYAMV